MLEVCPDLKHHLLVKIGGPTNINHVMYSTRYFIYVLELF